MFLVPNIDQMYKEMKKIVEVWYKHGNREGFCRSIIYFFVIKNVMVGQKRTYLFFWSCVKFLREQKFLFRNY
jgi:hypothetical protein